MFISSQLTHYFCNDTKIAGFIASEWQLMGNLIITKWIQ